MLSSWQRGKWGTVAYEKRKLKDNRNGAVIRGNSGGHHLF